MSQKRNDWREDALNCVRTLRGGGVVLSSTDTVWGLAADATHEQGVARIFELKSRPIHETLLMLVDSDGMLEHLIPGLPEAAWELIEVSDRPVTLVGQLNPNCRYRFAPGLVRADGSIAVRWVRDDYLAFMVNGLGRPIASTSANPSGFPTPNSFSEVDSNLVSGVDLAAASGRNEEKKNPPSMLVRFDEAGRIQILRS